MKILVCDDQAFICRSLTIVLEKQPDMKVVGEAYNGKEAVELVEELNPDLVLMDIRMPVMDGVKATQIIHKNHPNVKIIALTTFEEDELIVNSIASGAVGYILKDITTSDLIKAIQLIYDGTSILPTSFTKRFTHVKTDHEGENLKQDFNLTQREIEVLRYLLEGMSNKKIARKLFISDTTVKNHLTSIFTKLRVKNRTQAVLIAIQNQLFKE